MAPVADIALISLGTTPGLMRSDESFAALVRACGASCELVRMHIGASGRLRRNLAVTDFVEALAARRSARGVEARAVVYSTVTAALLQRPATPYAIRFDATASLNRPGPSGAWQRAAEKRALAGARVLIPVSSGAANAIPELDSGRPPVVRVPIPIEEVDAAPERDIDVVAYAGYPRKRGLELLCEAWARTAPPGGRFVIGGLDRAKALRWLARTGTPEPAGVEWAGELPRPQWIGIVARARAYLNASRWEDFGLGPLEALAAGTPLATVATPGSFEALPLARELRPELVAADLSAPALAEALRAALALDERSRVAYARRAHELLAPYRVDAVLATLRERVLPELGIEPA